mgnify:CR=1 FL=1
MNQSDFIFDKIFKQKLGHLAFNIEMYKKIYNLIEIQEVFEVSKEQFDYAKKKALFSVLCVYNEEGKIYLQKDFHDNYRALPGGSIYDTDDIHSAIRRISKKVHDEINIGEIEPIALVNNIFTYWGERHIHTGIVSIARVRNFDEIKKWLLSGDFVFINKQELHKINKYANNKIVQLALKRIKTFANNFPEHEIATNEKYKLRYVLHNSIVKRFLLTPKIKKKAIFNQLLYNKIGAIESFIDVSCGDNWFIDTLVKKIPQLKITVGNDISRSQIDLIKKDTDKILYTNHNAVYLPFKEKTFDISYCANTLHHMTSRKNMKNLLEGMFSIAKKMLIVEIERPKETGWIPYILNKYRYIWFLKDVGWAYLSQKEFEIVLYDLFKERAKITFSYFRNIQGKYMIAEIEEQKNNTLVQANRIVFQQFREKYEKMRLENQQQKNMVK